MGRKKNLIAGGVLMLVLGLARAAGGFILLRRGGGGRSEHPGTRSGGDPGRIFSCGSRGDSCAGGDRRLSF